VGAIGPGWAPSRRRAVRTTPISDAIRSHHKIVRNRARRPILDLALERFWQRRTSVRTSADDFILLQETKPLPPFQDDELEDPQLLASAASEIYRMRRARDRIMPQGLMGEPAWDILLALYSEEPDNLTVSSVCFGAGVPQSTALRWIGTLTKIGLVVRSLHPRDGRLILLSLSDEGRLVVERCLKAMLRASRG
jgi:DNA-binding MarR family transcriptional regulator